MGEELVLTITCSYDECPSVEKSVLDRPQSTAFTTLRRNMQEKGWEKLVRYGSSYSSPGTYWFCPTHSFLSRER